MVKRSNAYFGLHFDFHAVAETKGIGTKTVAENVGKYLDAVKPDYVQVDTKGHPGYTSFFSEYGDVAPGLEIDHLKIIREETAKRGIRLIAHHSGIYDVCACKNHPEWRAVKKDGSSNDTITDSTSEYADKKLIPQLKELALKYGFDGAWLDGDCWAVIESYRPDIVEQFCKKNGFDSIDDDPCSPSRLAFREYLSEKFVDYLSHVMNEVKKTCPDFEITSNWAFGTFMPQKPIDEIDFLSGDATCAHEIRMSSRCFSGKGKPWDIMSWGMSDCITSPSGGFSERAQKHLCRLFREASMVISMGGGYQIVNSMTPQGEIRMEDMEHMRVLSEFVKARKEWNYQSVPIKNAAVLYSDYDKLRRTEQLFGLTPISKGLCDLIIDGGRSIDVIYDYQVEAGNFGGRSTVILPDIKFLSDRLKEQLIRFAEQGGTLIVTGAAACKMFAGAAQAVITDDKERVIYLSERDYLYGYSGETVCFSKENCTELIPCLDGVIDSSASQLTASVMKSCGLGNIVFIGWDIFSDYNSNHRSLESNSMRRILDTIDPKPVAYLEKGLRRAEIIPAEKSGRLVINVINTNEYYYDTYGSGFAEIPPLTDIVVAVKTVSAPKDVRLQPENTAPEYSYDGEYIHVKIPRLDIHTIIEVQNN